MHGQSKFAALVALAVVSIIGGVTLLDKQNDSTTVVAGEQTVASTLPAASAASTSALPTTIAATVPATTASTTPRPPDEGCAPSGVSAAIDRDIQQAWLCLDGYITTQFPVSTAWSLPDPGVYEVFAKDRVTSSDFGDHLSTLKNFVAFTYGENTGARVAFHSIPILSDGSLIQPIDSVGALSRRGESSGCIRVQPNISELIWDTLSIGDPVTVLT